MESCILLRINSDISAIYFPLSLTLFKILFY